MRYYAVAGEGEGLGALEVGNSNQDQDTQGGGSRGEGGCDGGSGGIDRVVDEDIDIDDHDSRRMTKACCEGLGMALFIWSGAGTAMMHGQLIGQMQTELAFGLAIFVVVTAIGHHSGGQVNTAVTLMLWITGDLDGKQAVMNGIGQFLGACVGGGLLAATIPEAMDKTHQGSLHDGFATNAVSNGVLSGLIGEIAGSFLLCFVVLECAVNKASDKHNVALAIGMAVYMAHALLIAVDGCSINPPRSFGMAFIGVIGGRDIGNGFRDIWIFFVGPGLGALAAATYARGTWHNKHPSFLHGEPNKERTVVVKDDSIRGSSGGVIRGASWIREPNQHLSTGLPQDAASRGQPRTVIDGRTGGITSI